MFTAPCSRKPSAVTAFSFQLLLLSLMQYAAVPLLVLVLIGNNANLLIWRGIAPIPPCHCQGADSGRSLEECIHTTGIGIGIAARHCCCCCCCTFAAFPAIKNAVFLYAITLSNGGKT